METNAESQAGRGERILFSLLVVVLFWVNHLCAELRKSE